METDEDILDISQLEFNGDFNQQVQEVMCHVRLQRYEVEKLSKLFSDLYHIFNAVWRGIRVKGFGSIVTGLGMKTSDVDCYIELPSWLYPPEGSLVIKAKNVLMQHQHIFQDAFAISNARVPIVQFYHLPTKMYCDVSFNSANGVENSKLIAYLLESDRRALELAILIKYWSKIHSLSGKNLMSTYCLTMYVIFFLQQCNILQPVIDLQANVRENYIEQWNTAFAPSANKSSNNMTLYELLGEFFEYYKTFEYDKYMISPYLGRPIERKLFIDVETVPREFALYKVNVGTKKVKPIRLDGVMCVQDPFEHNRNCSVAVYPKLARKILAQIQTAVSIMESVPEYEFLANLLQPSAPTDTPVNTKPGKNTKQKQAHNHGVWKKHKRNQNFKQINDNVRQNHFRNLKQNNFRGRNRGAWRRTN